MAAYSRRYAKLKNYPFRSWLESVARSEYNETGYLAQFFGNGIATFSLEGLIMCLAVPGKILETKEENGSRFGRVQFGGITRQVQLDFVPEAGVGDYVIVHVGFALSKVNADEAERTYQLLEEMGMLDEELGAGGETAINTRDSGSSQSGSSES